MIKGELPEIGIQESDLTPVNWIEHGDRTFLQNVLSSSWSAVNVSSRMSSEEDEHTRTPRTPKRPKSGTGAGRINRVTHQIHLLRKMLARPHWLPDVGDKPPGSPSMQRTHHVFGSSRAQPSMTNPTLVGSSPRKVVIERPKRKRCEQCWTKVVKKSTLLVPCTHRNACLLRP